MSFISYILDMIGWVMDGWIEEFLVVFFSLSFITFVSYSVLFQNLTTHLKVGRFLFSYVCIDRVFGILSLSFLFFYQSYISSLI